jgi:menaquinone-specific isochorismate synthase
MTGRSPLAAPCRPPGHPDTARLVSRTAPLEEGTAASADLLDALGSGPGSFCWITGATGFVTAGVAARIPVRPGPGRFRGAAAEVAERLGAIPVEGLDGAPGPRGPGGVPRTPLAGPIAVGALPFGDQAWGELIVPAVVVGRDAAGRAWITETAPASAGRTPAVPLGPAVWPSGNGDGRAAGVGPGWPAVPVRERPARHQWQAAVRRVLAAIEAGQVRKVVLAREVVLQAAAPFCRRDVLDRLRRRNPSCFVYAAGGFVGASPELLVRRRGGEVESCPMAGTVARGATPDEDERLALGLSASAKDAEEHRLLVEAVLEALAPVCDGPPVATAAEIVRLATVSHLTTRVSGRLRRPAPSALELVGLLHPTPAVGGLPRRPALRAIAELEGFDRGLYAGPVGWVGAGGDGEWAVALRGAELDGSRARLVAGAGIVAGSDPDAEWAETEAKLATMLAAVGA